MATTTAPVFLPKNYIPSVYGEGDEDSSSVPSNSATYVPTPPLAQSNTGARDDLAVERAKEFKKRLSDYFAQLKTPEVPKELEQSLDMRKQALGGYFGQAGQAAMQPAMANAAQADAQRKAQLAAVMTRNQIAGPGVDRLQNRLARQMQQAQAGRMQQLGIENVGLSDQLSKAYERGILRNQGLRDQRQYMKLATDLAAEQMGMSGLLEEQGAREAKAYLDAMRGRA